MSNDSEPQIFSRNVLATGYEEAMVLALEDWNENWQGRQLLGIEIVELRASAWRWVRKHLRKDFAVYVRWVSE